MHRNILNVDAAPCTCLGFRIGIFVPPAGIRYYKCPPWINSLQQAEFYAIVQAYKLARYMSWSRVAVRSNSFRG